MCDYRVILVLEHNAVDASFLERSFQQKKVSHPARILRNSQQLRCYIEGVGSYTNRELFPLPNLVLLDLNYPALGLNALEWMRDSGLFMKFPVIGTGTMLPQMFVQKCFDTGLNGYFEKPADLQQLAKLICGLQWVDDLKPVMPPEAGVHLVTPRQFFSRPRQTAYGGNPIDSLTAEYSR